MAQYIIGMPYQFEVVHAVWLNTAALLFAHTPASSLPPASLPLGASIENLRLFMDVVGGIFF